MKLVWLVLTAVNYLLALFMMYAGVTTAFAPVDTQVAEHFGWLYNTRASLLVFGIWFFCSGLSLFLGKIFKQDSVVGHSLMSIYCCYVFAAILNWIALGWALGWPNLVGAGIVGALYLRWKYQLFYPQHRKVIRYEPTSRRKA
jgi:hypothetical protein